MPKHLSVILEVKDGKDGLEGVMGDACELAAWSASAGVGLLSVYERSGKTVISVVVRTIC